MSTIIILEMNLLLLIPKKVEIIPKSISKYENATLERNQSDKSIDRMLELVLNTPINNIYSDMMYKEYDREIKYYWFL